MRMWNVGARAVHALGTLGARWGSPKHSRFWKFQGANAAYSNAKEVLGRRFSRAGTFSQYLNGTTPRFFSPCGTCLSAGRPQRYRVTKPYYDFLGVVAEPINDGLLIPWTSDESRGTIWAISQGSAETFGPDDYKLLNTLADFAGISVRLAERERRTSSLRQLSADLMRVRDDEGRKIARELHDSVGQYLAAVMMNLDRLAKGSGNAGEILADTRHITLPAAHDKIHEVN
jgi:hypothetical protein